MFSDIDLSMGERIKKKREAKGLTQANIKNLTGISTGNLSDIENGRSLPSALSVIKLSKVLDCTTDWILTGESLKSDIIELSDLRENELLTGFRKLSEEDKEEFLGILQLKLHKSEKERMQKSPTWPSAEASNKIG